MERHFLEDLVEGEPGFVPEAYYDRHGDCIDYQSVDEPYHAERINSRITVYRSMEDDRVIGFLIKGVTRLLENHNADFMAVGTKENEDNSIALIVVILAALQTDERSPLKELKDLGSFIEKNLPGKKVSIAA